MSGVQKVRYQHLLIQHIHIAIQKKYCTYVTNSIMLYFLIGAIEIDVLVLLLHELINTLIEKYDIKSILMDQKMMLSDVPVEIDIRSTQLELYHIGI